MLNDKQIEKEQRDLEKLKTVDDYVYSIRVLSGVVCGTKKADKKIDETLVILVEALYEKYKYIIDISKPYRKKQGFFSKIGDYFKLRKLKKEQRDRVSELKQQGQAETQSLAEQVASSSSAFPAITQTKLEVIDKAPVKELTEGDDTPNDVMEF